MDNFFHNNKFQNIMKLLSILLIIFIFTVFLFGCSKRESTTISQTLAVPTVIPSMADETIPTITQTQNPVPPTATPILMTPTKTINPKYNFQITTDVTQESPTIVSTTYPENSEYLYKDAIVTLTLVDQFDAIDYLNLDDLTDNSMTNSDIEIERTIGNQSFYSLYPINNSYFNLPTESVVDYSTCLEYLPISGISQVDYSLLSAQLTYGYPYCVLTNEGRIAVVRYVPNSIKIIDNFVEGLSIEVTVYSKKIN
jgi:hypothetical protein